MKFTKIPNVNRQIIEERINKLAKKAVKLGCVPPTVKFSDPYIEEVDDFETGDKVRRVFVDVEVEGEAPQLNGWIFVGTLEHKENGNIVRSAPGARIPDFYRDAPCKCDHCGHNRVRRDTYIVANIVTGEYKQVGSACLRDFLGHIDPQAIVAFYEFLRKVEEGFTSEWTGKLIDREDVIVEEAIQAAFAIADVYGWVPKSKASVEDGIIATADRVFDFLFGHKPEYRYFVVTESAKEEAARALEWIKSDEVDTSNDYIYNLRTACSHDVAEYRDLGILVSLVGAYRRAMKKDEPKDEAPASEWVGNAGDRIEVDVECVFTYDRETMYGVTFIHKFQDDNGNVYVWFGSRPIADKGDKLRVRATVKDHSEYKGVKETVLTRCKLLETYYSANGNNYAC